MGGDNQRRIFQQITRLARCKERSTFRRRKPQRE
ncbi:hypothetical protein CTAM01_13185 [Colletotrichum tamarilloi]|uniref:Uncharacterized protein n=1 Tax=Colletotrichum tamarilloi TaxID=1209934 RepID=A0ABQ9QT10_9PEZI|nr:uncharacterized protein CTAM01_13185 [Colletotrichum tamarilloi]KAK1483960.1 hypothetical protein CTAM01_13185 [Colletotrichum tamarilloi]